MLLYSSVVNMPPCIPLLLLLLLVPQVRGREAQSEELEAVHSPELVRHVRQASEGSRQAQGSLAPAAPGAHAGTLGNDLDMGVPLAGPRWVGRGWG